MPTMTSISSRSPLQHRASLLSLRPILLTIGAKSVLGASRTQRAITIVLQNKTPAAPHRLWLLLPLKGISNSPTPRNYRIWPSPPFLFVLLPPPLSSSGFYFQWTASSVLSPVSCWDPDRDIPLKFPPLHTARDSTLWDIAHRRWDPKFNARLCYILILPF